MPTDMSQVASPCNVEALKKCLEQNNGDHSKCKKEVEAFSSSCGAASKSESSKK